MLGVWPGGHDLRGGSEVDQYVASIHFAMTTMATVGYGDVVPKSRVERIVAMLIMAIGRSPVPFEVSSLSLHQWWKQPSSIASNVWCMPVMWGVVLIRKGTDILFPVCRSAVLRAVNKCCWSIVEGQHPRPHPPIHVHCQCGQE